MGYKWAFRAIIYRNILQLAQVHNVPVGPTTFVNDINNLKFSLDDLNNLQSPGCYFQCFAAKIYIGRGTYIAPNVGIITSNHDKSNLHKHLEGKDVTIGENCWIGMNSIILPGVTIADNTVIGAGSIVTKNINSPGQTYIGNPAVPLRK